MSGGRLSFIMQAGHRAELAISSNHSSAYVLILEPKHYFAVYLEKCRGISHAVRPSYDSLAPTTTSCCGQCLW